MLLKLWLRGRKSPAYRQRIGERFGFPSKVSATPPLWVHAVSVGECVAIAPVLKQLLALYPKLTILVTTSTPTGADRIGKLFAGYSQLWHQYCPYDQPGSVARFLRAHKPQGLLIVETELWPNMLAQCHSNDIPVLLANARMSDKSARGYAKVASLTKQMLQHLDLLVAQYDSDGERFVQLGLEHKKLLISGSIKFDLQIAANTLPDAANLRRQIGSRAVLILGSSHNTEEQGLLELLVQLWRQFPDLLLIIVPRHPERFTEVTELAKKYSDRVIRRSTGQFDPSCQIYIGDTMGELGMLYAVADLAVVGGSFVAVGGQSPLEPASVAKGVLMGPQQYNFSVICPQLEAAQGMHSCSDYTELLQQLQRLLAAPELMREMGLRAEKYFLSQRGATAIVLQQIQLVLLKQ